MSSIVINRAKHAQSIVIIKHKCILVQSYDRHKHIAIFMKLYSRAVCRATLSNTT